MGLLAAGDLHDEEVPEYLSLGPKGILSVASGVAT